MVHRLWVFLILLPLMTGTAAAQDAKVVLQAASRAMGADILNTIQISGAGTNAATGQSFDPVSGDLATEDWPKFEVPSYTKTIDYGTRSSREEFTERQGRFGPRGGGGTPLQRDRQSVRIVNGDFAWNMQGTTANPALAVAEVRQLDIWLTPHGVLKAAMAAPDATAVVFPVNGPSNPGLTQNGNRRTIVSFTALGKYRVNVTINDQNLVELVQTWVANPVLGDMLYETRYVNYQDYAGVKFPGVIHSHEGDPWVNKGHNTWNIIVSGVQVNPAVPTMTVPDAVRQAVAPAVRAESQELADGVWLVGGGSHNSVVIEFRDFVAVIEAPLNEARSLAVIGEVERLIPNKPIRYLVNTHHHFDHAGGLRTYVALGTTIVTHPENREFYEKAVFSPGPRTLRPDRLSTLYPYFGIDREPRLETVMHIGDMRNTGYNKFVVSDGVRSLDIYPVHGLAHANTMLIAYLPNERMLVNADLYSPPAPGAQPPASPSPASVTLQQNIQRLKLDVTQHVPIHGRVGTMEEFVKIVGTGTN